MIGSVLVPEVLEIPNPETISMVSMVISVDILPIARAEELMLIREGNKF